MKVIFFDRDDTLIVDKNYMKDPNLIEFFPDTINALKIIQHLGYSMILITNQSGIGRGIITENDVKNIHQKLQMKLLEHNLTPFIEIQFCPHSPEQLCECRKPKPLMINKMIQKYFLDKNQCFMVGDRESDYLAGINAGIASYYIHNKEQTQNSFANLMQFAQFLENQSKRI